MSNPTNQIEVSPISEAGLAVHPSIAFVAPKSVYVYYYVQQGQILYFNHLHESFYVSEAQFVEVLKQYEIKKVKINPIGVNEKAMRELVSSVSEPMPIKVLPLRTKRVTEVAANTAVITFLQTETTNFLTKKLVHMLLEDMKPLAIWDSNLETFFEDKGIDTLFVDTHYVEISDVENLLNLPLEPIEEPPVREKRMGGYRFNRCFSELDYTTAKDLKVFICSISDGRVYAYNKKGKFFNPTIGAFYNWLKDNGVTTIHINSDLDIDEVAELLDIHD